MVSSLLSQLTDAVESGDDSKLRSVKLDALDSPGILKSYLERTIKIQRFLPESFDLEVGLTKEGDEPFVSIFLVTLPIDGEDFDQATDDAFDNLVRFLERSKLSRFFDEVCVNFKYRRLG